MTAQSMLLRIAGALLLLAAVSTASTNLDFGFSIDAGSTGTRIYVYAWPKHATEQHSFIVPDTQSDWTLKVTPGISHFSDNPAGVAGFLQPLIDFAVQRVTAAGASPSRFQHFPIYLKATAGLRVLPQPRRDALMAAVRAYLDSTPFMFDDSMARVISGEEEGVYGWITVNFNEHTLHAGANSFGVLDMGGDSVEMTFVPQHDIMADLFPIRLKGQDVNVYTHSYLQFGVRATRLRARVQLVAGSSALQRAPSKRHRRQQPAIAAGLDTEDAEPGAQERRLPLELSHERLESLARAWSAEHSSAQPQSQMLASGAAPQTASTEFVPSTQERGRWLPPLGSIEDAYQHPCFPSGHVFNDSLTDEGRTPALQWFAGTSNFTGCLSLLLSLVPKNSQCWYRSCSFSSVYQPRLGNSTFVATSYFQTSVVEDLGLPADASLRQVAEAAREVCSLSWQELRSRYPTRPARTVAVVCSDAVWTFAMLSYGFGFNLDARGRIRYVPDPGQRGAILYEVNRLQSLLQLSRARNGQDSDDEADVEHRQLRDEERDLIFYRESTLGLCIALGVVSIASLLYIVQLRDRLAQHSYTTIQDEVG